MVSPGNLAWLRQAAAAADEPGHGDAVVRRAKRPRPVQRSGGGQLAEKAPDLRHLERLGELERGKDAWQAAGEHCLARARRPTHQEVMASGRGDLERALRLLLAVDLSEVVLDVSRRGAVEAFRRRWCNRLKAEDVVHDGDERWAWNHLEPVDQRCLSGIGDRHEDAFIAERAQATSRDQDTVDVANRAVEGELAQERAVRWGRFARPRQRDGNRDRKVEGGAFLAHLGRRQVDRETRVRKLEPAVADRRTNALASLLDRCRREADQHECDLTPPDVSLDMDGPRVQADEHARVDGSEHGLELIEREKANQPRLLRR